MSRLAIVDATHHTEAFGPSDRVAGMPAVVRAAKLMDVSDVSHGVVAADPGEASTIENLIDGADLEAAFQVIEVETSDLATVVQAADSEWGDAVSDASSVLYGRSTTFGFRDIPGDLAEAAEHENCAVWLDASDDDDTATRAGDFWAVSTDLWPRVVGLAEEKAPASPSNLADALSAATTGNTVRYERPPRSWQMKIDNQTQAEKAGDQIWEDCRKPTDGPVSRYLNRHVSMAVSRRLAETNIKPNQVSIVALFVAMASAPFAVMGGYFGFLGATLVYKLNSIIDGIDGELSRGNYDFSDLGAWLDKFCDDCADLFWFVGSGVGAWRTGVADPLGVGPEFWLWIIGIFLTGKALCSVSFYSIPFREGELVHPYRSLDWWFEDDEGDTKESLFDKVAGFFKVLTGNDVFVGISLVFAILGMLPAFLILMGVGQVFVGIGRTYQIQKQWGRTADERPARAAGD